MRRSFRLLLNNASTLVFAAFVVILLLLLREDTLSPYVWALMNGETSWRMALEDHTLTSEVISKTLFVFFSLFCLSLALFGLIADHLAIKDEERDPPLRAMDEDANRFIGILLGSVGIYLAAAPGGAVLYSSVFGAVTILWGFQLLFMAEEDKDNYTVSGASKLFGGTDREWSGDPLFRAWARKVKDRFKREEEQARAWQQQRQREREEYARQQRRASSAGSRQKSEQGPSAPWTIEDPWSVLGVEPGTPMKKITQKWRRLCKRYHPDVVPTGLKEETEEALKKINAAYRMIKEKQKKLQQEQAKEEE